MSTISGSSSNGGLRFSGDGSRNFTPDSPSSPKSQLPINVLERLPSPQKPMQMSARAKSFRQSFQIKIKDEFGRPYEITIVGTHRMHKNVYELPNGEYLSAVPQDLDLEKSKLEKFIVESNNNKIKKLLERVDHFIHQPRLDLFEHGVMLWEVNAKVFESLDIAILKEKVNEYLLLIPTESEKVHSFLKSIEESTVFSEIIMNYLDHLLQQPDDDLIAHGLALNLWNQYLNQLNTADEETLKKVVQKILFRIPSRSEKVDQIIDDLKKISTQKIFVEVLHGYMEHLIKQNTFDTLDRALTLWNHYASDLSILSDDILCEIARKFLYYIPFDEQNIENFFESFPKLSTRPQEFLVKVVLSHLSDIKSAPFVLSPYHSIFYYNILNEHMSAIEGNQEYLRKTLFFFASRVNTADIATPQSCGNLCLSLHDKKTMTPDMFKLINDCLTMITKLNANEPGVASVLSDILKIFKSQSIQDNEIWKLILISATNNLDFKLTSFIIKYFSKKMITMDVSDFCDEDIGVFNTHISVMLSKHTPQELSSLLTGKNHFAELIINAPEKVFSICAKNLFEHYLRIVNSKKGKKSSSLIHQIVRLRNRMLTEAITEASSVGCSTSSNHNHEGTQKFKACDAPILTFASQRHDSNIIQETINYFRTLLTNTYDKDSQNILQENLLKFLTMNLSLKDVNDDTIKEILDLFDLLEYESPISFLYSVIELLIKSSNQDCLAKAAALFSMNQYKLINENTNIKYSKIFLNACNVFLERGDKGLLLSMTGILLNCKIKTTIVQKKLDDFWQHLLIKLMEDQTIALQNNDDSNFLKVIEIALLNQHRMKNKIKSSELTSIFLQCARLISERNVTRALSVYEMICNLSSFNQNVILDLLLEDFKLETNINHEGWGLFNLIFTKQLAQNKISQRKAFDIILKLLSTESESHINVYRYLQIANFTDIDSNFLVRVFNDFNLSIDLDNKVWTLFHIAFLKKLTTKNIPAKTAFEIIKKLITANPHPHLFHYLRYISFFDLIRENVLNAARIKEFIDFVANGNIDYIHYIYDILNALKRYEVTKHNELIELVHYFIFNVSPDNVDNFIKHIKEVNNIVSGCISCMPFTINNQKSYNRKLAQISILLRQDIFQFQKGDSNTDSPSCASQPSSSNVKHVLKEHYTVLKERLYEDLEAVIDYLMRMNSTTAQAYSLDVALITLRNYFESDYMGLKPLFDKIFNHYSLYPLMRIDDSQMYIGMHSMASRIIHYISLLEKYEDGSIIKLKKLFLDAFWIYLVKISEPVFKENKMNWLSNICQLISFVTKLQEFRVLSEEDGGALNYHLKILHVILTKRDEFKNSEFNDLLRSICEHLRVIHIAPEQAEKLKKALMDQFHIKLNLSKNPRIDG